MFRPAVLAAARAASARAVFRPSVIPQRFTRLAIPQTKSFVPLGVRCYSAGGVLKEDEVKGRIMDLLKNFDKVKDVSKLTPTSEFGKDLGLDSLDTVEVVMAIEEEFGIEIPDKDADGIHSVEQAISYIKSQPDAH